MNVDITKVLDEYKRKLSDAQHENVILTAQVAQLTEEIEGLRHEAKEAKDDGRRETG